MAAASRKASGIVAKRINRDQLVSSLSKRRGALEHGKFGKLLPNDFAEADTRQEDEAVVANAKPLEYSERLSRCVRAIFPDPVTKLFLRLNKNRTAVKLTETCLILPKVLNTKYASFHRLPTGST